MTTKKKAKSNAKQKKSINKQIPPVELCYTISGYEDGHPFTRTLNTLDRWAAQSAETISIMYSFPSLKPLPTYSIDIFQNRHSEIGGYIWDTSFILSSWLLCTQISNVHDWKEKKCLEFGAGVGLVGLILGILKAEIVLTDLPEISPVTRENVEKNLQNYNNARVMNLSWGLDGDIREILKLYGWFDYLFAVDCIYSEVSATDLVYSMEKICRMSRTAKKAASSESIDTIIYCVSEVRNQDAQECFVREALKVFDIEMREGKDWFPFVPESLRVDYVNFYMMKLKLE
ncbi:putative methyltransferase-domain-containing protein [Paraphysoderma sedebokerense]|nr:putative methyltransferase-domain-containing protein [Paraphysoderma sedebokerense]